MEREISEVLRRDFTLNRNALYKTLSVVVNAFEIENAGTSRWFVRAREWRVEDLRSSVDRVRSCMRVGCFSLQVHFCWKEWYASLQRKWHASRAMMMASTSVDSIISW